MSLKFLHFSYVTNDKMKLATLKDRHFFYLQSHEIIGGTRTVEALRGLGGVDLFAVDSHLASASSVVCTGLL